MYPRNPTGMNHSNGTGVKGLAQAKRIEAGTVGKIWDHHREMIRLIVIGWKPIDIARHLGVSVTTVKETKNNPIVMRQIAIAQGARDCEALDVAIEIKNAAPKALKVLEELMESSPKDAVRLSAAVDILDRAGYAAPKKFEGVVAYLTAEEVTEMRRRMAEATANESLASTGSMEG